MHDKKSVQKLLKNGFAAMGKASLPPGLYTGQKVNDEYLILVKGETDSKYRELKEGEEFKTGIILSDVHVHETGNSARIAVNADFVNWDTKTNFPFRINDEFYSELILKQLTDKEARELSAK